MRITSEDISDMKLGPIYQNFYPGDKVRRWVDGPYGEQVGEVVSVHEMHFGVTSRVGVCWGRGVKDFTVIDTDLLKMHEPDMKAHAYDLRYFDHPESLIGWRKLDGSPHYFDDESVFPWAELP